MVGGVEEQIEQNGGPVPSSSEPRPSFFARVWFELGEFFKVAIISLAIVLPIRFFVAQPFVVRGASMEPNFQEGQYLIIDEASYYLRPPQRGEVIVFRYPNNTSEFFIKRIIGLPGEHVGIKDNEVRIINTEHPEGFLLSETYLPTGALTIYDASIDLTPDQYFVMGDNRIYSSDSRRWGPLDKKFLIGRAWLRLWPLGTAGSVPSPSYQGQHAPI